MLVIHHIPQQRLTFATPRVIHSFTVKIVQTTSIMTRNSQRGIASAAYRQQGVSSCHQKAKGKRTTRWGLPRQNQKEAVLVAYTKYPLKDETN